MKRFAKTENNTIAKLPLIVGIDPIAIQPPLAVSITLDAEHVRIVVGVS